MPSFYLWSAIAQAVQWLATGWTVQGSKLRPVRPWGLLYLLFSGGKAAGVWCQPLNPSNAEVTEKCRHIHLLPLWTYVACSKVNLTIIFTLTSLYSTLFKQRYHLPPPQLIGKLGTWYEVLFSWILCCKGFKCHNIWNSAFLKSCFLMYLLSSPLHASYQHFPRCGNQKQRKKYPISRHTTLNKRHGTAAKHCTSATLSLCGR
jgi:hypothetical protein